MGITIDGLRMLGAQENVVASVSGLDATSAPGQAPSEIIITALKRHDRVDLSGIATGIRLTTNADYPSDAEAALADWVQRFETVVAAEQGDGWQLTDDERDETIQVVATDGNWVYSAGAPLEVQWGLTLQRGNGVLAESPRAPTTATPTGTTTLSGTDLGSIREKRTQRSIDVETTPIAFGGAGDTVVTPTSGVTKQVTVSGRVGGSESELRTFDDTMQGYVGGNQSLDYQTGFPGTSHTVTVDRYDSTFVGGQPATMRYSLTLVEGIAV